MRNDIPVAGKWGLGTGVGRGLSGVDATLMSGGDAVHVEIDMGVDLLAYRYSTDDRVHVLRGQTVIGAQRCAHCHGAAYATGTAAASSYGVVQVL